MIGEHWDATTRRLVDYAMASDYGALGPDVVHACKLRLIDTFAAAMGAYDAPLSAMARRVASRTRGDDAARVWGSGIVTTAEAAAFANGVMARLLDVSDTYLGKSRGHPSDMTSGLIAAAEVADANGESLLNAVVLAYDVYCTCCDAADFNARGWDQPVYGILGCVVGAGRLLRLTHEQMANAIALALAPNMALAQSRRGHLSSWKGCAGANASRNAIFAAMLAREGFTGPPAIFEGAGGLFEATGGAIEWRLPEGRHMIVETHIKGLPFCYHGQAPVWAAIELRPRVRVAEIESIEVDTYATGVVMMGAEPSRWAPTTRETADHSLPYCVAVALLDGRVTDASFADERLVDPALGALMRKVKVREDRRFNVQYPEGSPGRVTIHTTSGERHTHEIRYPYGHARNPAPDAQVEQKFRDFCLPHLGENGCEAVLGTIPNLEQTDVGTLVTHLTRVR